MEKTEKIVYDDCMSRNFVTDAIVFSVKPLGENNSSVCFLTREFGIVYATMYGGAKSRLRSLASAWNSGRAFLYTKEKSPDLHGSKLSDFDVKNYHLSFRENLYKLYAASFAAELIIKTNCAASFELCWHLAKGFFDGLELANNHESSLGLIRFLFRYLDLLGVKPDASHCAICKKKFAYGNDDENAVVYDETENYFVCASCAKKEARFFLSEEAALYLVAATDEDAKTARAKKISSEAEKNAKSLVFFLAEQAAGTKLKSLDIGRTML